MIDPVSAETPVFVQRLDGHTALANSAALRLAGITAATTDPAGGTIERDPGTGEPTGILKDTAMDMVQAVIPPPTAQEIEKAVERALREAHRNGITSIHDVSEVEHVEVYRKLEKEGKLTCRIFSRLPLAGYARLVAEKTRAGSGTEVLSLGSMKAFSDGSLGSNTALFFEPYVNEPSTCGLAMEVLTTGKLRSWALEADRNGLQLSVHAIGDRANHLVLEIFEEIVRVNPPWHRRFRIEHAQHVRPQDLPRFAALGVIVSAQPYHCIDDGWWAASRIGEARCAYTYAFRNFLRAGVRVCFGSDWTVAPLNAILGIYAAVTRRTTDGGYPGGWYPDQKLTVEEAIRCYTINNAFASFEENRKGSITPGKLADMVVLSHDITRMVPEEIGNATVDLTVWNGEVVHER
jgi:predicted amidohydrolase YtcJ